MSLKLILTKSIEFLSKQTLQQITIVENYPKPKHKQVNAKRRFEVVFPVALFLHALAKVPDYLISSELHELKVSALNYLAQQGKGYSWNYWTRESEFNDSLPLPDDSDDTAFALAALTLNNLEIDPAYWFKLLKLEVAAGGPYQTWYLAAEKGSRWYSVDIAVNTNIYYLAALQGIKLAGLEEYLLKISKENLNSEFYPYPELTCFYLARAASAANNQKLLSSVAGFVRGLPKPAHPQQQLLQLLASSYIAPAKQLAEVSEFLHKYQNPDGSFPNWPICWDFAEQKQLTFTGSSIATTSLVVELICRNLAENQHKLSSIETGSYPSIRLHSLVAEALGFSQSMEKVPNVASIILLTFAVQSVSTEQKELLMNFIRAFYQLSSIVSKLDKQIDSRQVTAVEFPKSEVKRVLAILPQPLRGTARNCLQRILDSYNWERQELQFDSDIELRQKADNAQKLRYLKDRYGGFVELISLVIPLASANYDEKLLATVVDALTKLAIVQQLSDDLIDWPEDHVAGRITHITYLLSNNYSKKDFWLRAIPAIVSFAEKVALSVQYDLAILHHYKLNTQMLRELITQTFAPLEAAAKLLKAARSQASNQITKDSL